ncbi:MAG: TRAP transporter substrate-binding protein DctP [Pseudomonadota bacterium]
MFKRFFLVFFCAVFITGVGPASAGAETLKLQVVYPETSHVGKVVKFFKADLEKLSSGGMQVEIIWPGSEQFIPTAEAFEGLVQGRIGLYVTSLLYHEKEVPEGSCQWLPFNWETPEEAKEILLNKGFVKTLSAAVEKKGALYLAPLSVATMGLMTTFPINKLEDIKGKNLRAVGFEAKIVSALGGVPVPTSPNDQLEKMKAGQILGTDYPWYTMEVYKFYEVLKHISAPGLHTPGVIDFLAGKKAVEALPEAQQKAIRQAAHDAMEYSFTAAREIDQKVLADAKKRNVEMTILSFEEQARFREALKPLWEEEAKKSPEASELVSILLSVLISKGYQW